jgi:hypothetical protein
MQDAFLIVVIGVSVLALIGAVVALATSGGAYDRIGRDGTVPDDAPGAPDRGARGRDGPQRAARRARRAPARRGGRGRPAPARRIGR